MLPARREGARGKDRRTVEMGRPVRLRPRRRGSAVPARARRAVRGRAGDPGGDWGAGLRGDPHHLPWRRRHGDLRQGPRGGARQEGPRGLGEPLQAGWHRRLLLGPETAAGDAGRDVVARLVGAGGRRPDLQRDAARARDRRGDDRRTGRDGPRTQVQEPRDARRRARDWPAVAPALVRRPPALRETDRRDAAPGTGRGTGGGARAAWRDRRGGPHRPHRAARGFRPARRGVCGGRSVPTG